MSELEVLIIVTCIFWVGCALTGYYQGKGLL